MCALTWNACRCRAGVYRWRAWLTEATACRYQAASSSSWGISALPHEQLHLDVGHQLLQFFRGRDAGTAGQRGGQQPEV